LGNPKRFYDTYGLDVSICLFSGIPNHVGLGVNTTNTTGRRTDGTSTLTDIFSGDDVPGEVSLDDPYNTDSHKQCTTIKTTSEQDKTIQDYINRHIADPGNYNLYSRSCVDFVRDILRKELGMNLSNTDLPSNFYHEVDDTINPVDDDDFGF